MSLTSGTQVYTNPQTPAHLRQVLARLAQQDSSFEDDIAAIILRLDALEEQIGEDTPTAITDSNVVPGNVLYMKGTGNVDLADASAVATANVIGAALETITAGGTVKFTINGRVTRADWTAVAGAASLTPGAQYYLSETAGLITTTSPTAIGAVSIRIGKAISTTELEMEIAIGVLL